MKLFTDVSENTISGDLTAIVFDVDNNFPVGYYPHAQNVENLVDAIGNNFKMLELQPMYKFEESMYDTLIASNDPTCVFNKNATFYKGIYFWFDSMSNETLNCLQK